MTVFISENTQNKGNRSKKSMSCKFFSFFFFQERYFREQQQELNTWNQNFWGKQNEKFNKVGYVIFYFLKNR